VSREVARRSRREGRRPRRVPLLPDVRNVLVWPQRAGDAVRQFGGYSACGRRRICGYLVVGPERVPYPERAFSYVEAGHSPTRSPLRCTPAARSAYRPGDKVLLVERAAASASHRSGGEAGARLGAGRRRDRREAGDGPLGRAGRGDRRAAARSCQSRCWPGPEAAASKQRSDFVSSAETLEACIRSLAQAAGSSSSEPPQIRVRQGPTFESTPA